MERKIGEIFEYNGEWYQCVESQNGSCKYCDMNFEDKCPIPIKECTESGRSDKYYVIFKKLEKVGEPFSCNYYGDARLVMMQEYQLYEANAIYNYDSPPMYISYYKHKRIAIEIKQNKEDMGDNDDIRPYDELFSPGTFSNTKYLAKEDMEDLDKIKVRDYTKVEELNVMEEKKLNLKPFDIQKAKEGYPVYTRDGRKARIVCFDRIDARPILALVSSTDGKGENVFDYFVSGKRIANSLESDLDLMMLPEKKEGWVNVYKDSVYNTKNEALIERSDIGYIDTIKIS